jgi:hypothetical protein
MGLKGMQLQYFMESKKLKLIQDAELIGNHVAGRKCNLTF